MKKTKVNRNDWEVPELPPNAVLRPPRRRPPTNARMPQKKITLPIDVDIIAWFKGEAVRGGLNHTDHINKALRQYIIDLIGDKPVSQPSHKRQDAKAHPCVSETLA
jgi:uncharacterized protein (DUF4415 family)